VGGERLVLPLFPVDVTADGELDPGRPSLLFDGHYEAFYPISNYDVSHDGRWVMSPVTEPEPQPVTQINIVLNWFEELKRLVPWVSRLRQSHLAKCLPSYE